MTNLYENFQIHDTLNPKIWDSAGQLLPQIKQKIIEIIKLFEDELTIPLEIVDVQIVGSNASYNYIIDTNYSSDLDVHIIANFALVDTNTDLVGEVYNIEKINFNKEHNISFYGIKVELYVQDINATCISNGIYSVLDNKWIKEPKPLKTASKKNVEKELEAWRVHIAKIIQSHDLDEIKNSLNTLYLIRHNSLAAEGEFGKGAQLFKEIRSQGLLDKLKDSYDELIDQKLTLESFQKGCSKGQLINRDILDEGLTYNCTATIILPDDSRIDWKSQQYANSKEKAINSMIYNIHTKYGYKVLIRNTEASL